ncbi:hypothetical protein JCM10212_003442, partial [Sporobolomyces blumeae]
MGIGPQLPPHLVATVTASSSSGAPGPTVSENTTTTAGPSLPPHPPRATSRDGPAAETSTTTTTRPDPDSDSDDDFGPALPPDLVEARHHQPAPSSVPSPTIDRPRSTAKVVAGPQLPPHLVSSSGREGRSGPSSSRQRSVVSPTPGRQDDDDDDDDDFGPGPLPPPAGFDRTLANDNEGRRAFLEREERQRDHERQERERANAKPRREEWMLVPPKEMDLLSTMDPTKLKSRTFISGPKAQQASSSSGQKSSGPNLWTETPAERQQRLEDEALGRTKKAEQGLGGDGRGADVEEDLSDEARRKRRRDWELKQEVERHN